jgi:hypothetical protein
VPASEIREANYDLSLGRWHDLKLDWPTFLDDFQRYSAAAWMRRADLDGSLAAGLNPSLATPERAVAQVEGWILGVA